MGGKIWRFGALDRINGIERGVVFSDCRVGHDHRQRAGELHHITAASTVRNPPTTQSPGSYVRPVACPVGGWASSSEPATESAVEKRWRAAIAPLAVKTVLALPFPARQSVHPALLTPPPPFAHIKP